MTSTASTTARKGTTDPEFDALVYRTWADAGENGREAARRLGIAQSSFRSALKRHQDAIAAAADEFAEYEQPDPQPGPDAGAAFEAALEAGEVTLTPSAEAVAAAGEPDPGPAPKAPKPRSRASRAAAQAATDAARQVPPNDRKHRTAGETEPAAPAPAKRSYKGTYKPKPAVNDCACGCATKTGRVFVRGHDSKLNSALRKAYAAGELTRDQALDRAGQVSAQFLGKVTKSLDQVDAGNRPGTGVCPCCGTTTARTFVRGHDSRHAKQLTAAYVAGERTREATLELAGQISARFLGKVTKALGRADARAEAAQAKQAAAPAPEAPAQAPAARKAPARRKGGRK